MAERTAKTALFDAFAQVGKALGSGRRIELLDVLANGERTVEELARQTDLSLANASRHLPSTTSRLATRPGRCRSRCARSSPPGWAGRSTTPSRWWWCSTTTRT